MMQLVCLAPDICLHAPVMAKEHLTPRAMKGVNMLILPMNTKRGLFQRRKRRGNIGNRRTR